MACVYLEEKSQHSLSDSHNSYYLFGSDVEVIIFYACLKSDSIMARKSQTIFDFLVVK